MSNALFVDATRQRFRFKTPNGDVSTEDLWELPLTSTVGKANLDDIAKSLHKQLKDSDGEVSFVKPVVKKTADIQARFDVVKTVLEFKVAERDAAASAAEKKEKKQKLLELLDKKNNAALESKSAEEIQAMLKDL